jgi:hypothetical protein
MSSSKKIDLESDVAAGVYLSEAQQNPISPPPYGYRILIPHARGGGGVEPERREEFTKLGRKYQHDCASPVYKL